MVNVLLLKEKIVTLLTPSNKVTSKIQIMPLGNSLVKVIMKNHSSTVMVTKWLVVTITSVKVLLLN